MTTEKYIQLLELLNEFAEENGVTHHIDVYGSESKEDFLKKVQMNQFHNAIELVKEVVLFSF